MTDMSMKIDNDKVVTFHYALRDSEGSFSESTPPAPASESVLTGAGSTRT